MSLPGDQKRERLRRHQEDRQDVEDAQSESLWVDLPEFKSPRFDLRKRRMLDDVDRDVDDDPDIQGDPDMTYSSRSSSFSPQVSMMDKTSTREKRAMYPFTVHAYDFKPGDWVKAILSEVTLSSYVGKVIDVLPKANKVVVKWPHKARQEDPEWLQKLNKEESGIAVTSSQVHALLRNRSRVAQNLVRIACGLRGTGISDVAAFLKMKQAFGADHPMSWIKGAVEIAWPKRTASYSSEADLVRSLFRYAQDLDSILADSGEAQDDGLSKELPAEDEVEAKCKKAREFDPLEPDFFEEEEEPDPAWLSDALEEFEVPMEEEEWEPERLRKRKRENPAFEEDWLTEDLYQDLNRFKG